MIENKGRKYQRSINSTIKNLYNLLKMKLIKIANNNRINKKIDANWISSISIKNKSF